MYSFDLFGGADSCEPGSLPLLERFLAYAGYLKNLPSQWPGEELLIKGINGCLQMSFQKGDRGGGQVSPSNVVQMGNELQAQGLIGGETRGKPPSLNEYRRVATNFGMRMVPWLCEVGGIPTIRFERPYGRLVQPCELWRKVSRDGKSYFRIAQDSGGGGGRSLPWANEYCVLSQYVSE
jgi:hypothetical protein